MVAYDLRQEHSRHDDIHLFAYVTQATHSDGIRGLIMADVPTDSGAQR